jgi:hypothetical protein
MRTLLILGALSLVPGAAVAQTPAAVPFTCEKIAAVPSEMRTETPLLAARISMAACGGAARMGALTVYDDDTSLRAMADALGTSLATLDDVATSPDPRWQLLAAEARADLELGLVTRMRAAIPPVPADETGEALLRDEADRAARRARLEAKLAPWIERATADLQRTLAIAQASPQLGHDVAIDGAIRRAQQDLEAFGRTR